MEEEPPMNPWNLVLKISQPTIEENAPQCFKSLSQAKLEPSKKEETGPKYAISNSLVLNTCND